MQQNTPPCFFVLANCCTCVLHAVLLHMASGWEGSCTDPADKFVLSVGAAAVGGRITLRNRFSPLVLQCTTIFNNSTINKLMARGTMPERGQYNSGQYIYIKIILSYLKSILFISMRGIEANLVE